jgi:Ser/Thr protein kinase RdoA (MazF antagonist)
MPEAETAPSDAALREGLERALDGVGLAAPRRIRRLHFEYATSFPLEQLELTLEDGKELHLLFKQLAWATLNEQARLAKPRFLHDPKREPAVYASLLSPREIGPRYYGAEIEPLAGRYWLFAERVDGRELYQVGELEQWQAVARWLAQTHAFLAGELEDYAARLRLIDYDEVYYRQWIARARQFAAAEEASQRLRAIDWLAARYDAVVGALVELPRTVLHGEFYASNVLVAGDAASPRVCPVDWELAAAGPGLVDLAALVSGGWENEQREAIVAAYRAEVGAERCSPRQLGLARLHLAVHWLGWAPPAWAPPEGQRHDWLGEAIRLAEELEL